MPDEWEQQVATLRKAIAENKLAMDDMRGLINELRQRLAHYEHADQSPPVKAQTSQAPIPPKPVKNRTAS